MFRRKITRKLTLLVATSLIILMGIVILAQFLIVSRSYMTTEYTKVRIRDLMDASYMLKDRYLDAEGNSDKITSALNRYADENSACCLILNDEYEIEQSSDNITDLKRSYLTYVQKMLRDGKGYANSDQSFRIQNLLNLPTKYIGIYQPISLDQWKPDTSGKVYFVAITKEVYTNENYTILKEYSGFLFSIVAIVAVALAAAFSYLVTKPVLKIRDTAARMIDLDFTQKCDYKARDELGDLANSLNHLSEKLNDTILQLEVANGKLQQDLNAQREIDRMRKSFVASVSHEFKTPLTLIRGYLEMMEDNRLSGTDLQSAEKVMIGEVDRLDKMVLDLLDLSRLEADTYAVNRENFCISELLSQIAEKCNIVLQEHKIRFSVVCEAAPDDVYAERRGIEQVVLNFLTNAIKNTAENGTIILKCQNEKDVIMVSVFNEGSQIKETELERIWDQFYRIDKARSRKEGGTGLGLTICREILEKHESVYGVENVEGGVRFFFTLKHSK